MDLEDDAPLTLPKWPFYVGDVFLVGSAIAIAVLGGGNLTGWQVASCVIAVGLGAFLFVLPFIVEYQLRLKERGEGISRLQATLEHHLTALGHRLEALEQDAAGWQARLDAIAKGSEGAVKRVETKVASLADAAASGAGFEEELAAVRKNLAVLSSDMKKRLAEMKEALPEEGGVQAAVFASLSEKVKSLSARLEAAERATEQAPKAPGDEPVAAAEAPESRKPRKKKEPGSKLLHRAIKENGEPAAPAVSRIISAGPKAKPGAAQPDASEAAAPSPPPDALFSEVGEATPKPRKPRRRKGQGKVVAHVLIGIGNKPYLRGSGGGLSWEKGVPMEFDEIGKWSWTAPQECEAIEVCVYRNDEDADQGGKATLKPGETLELSPQF